MSTDLLCGFCGGSLYIEMGWVGDDEGRPESIGCDSTACGAVWETDGTLRDKPDRWSA